MTSSSRAALVASAQRPIPLMKRPDLAIRVVQYGGRQWHVVKDVLSLRYFRLPPEKTRILELLDGRTSLEQIRERLQQDFPDAELTSAGIYRLASELHREGLVTSDREGQGAALAAMTAESRRAALWNALGNLLFIRLPGWDPSRLLAALDPIGRAVFHPLAVMLGTAFVLGSWTLLLTRFDEFQRQIPPMSQIASGPNLVLIWLTLGVLKLIHELGHGLSCQRFGGECHEIGIAFMVFSPSLYCDVSDSWLFESKWKRIAVSAAGMYVELLISSLALWGWAASGLGQFHDLCLNAFLVSGIGTVLFNMNPLVRYDGYYILADWLEIPNLRFKADRLLKRRVGAFFLKDRTTDDHFEPAQGHLGLMVYSAASIGYRWILTAGMIAFAWSVSEAVGLRFVVVLVVALTAIIQFISHARAAGMVVRSLDMRRVSRRRVAVALVGCGAALAAFCLAPIPYWLEADVVLEPRGVHHVYVSTPGRLESLLAKAGDSVRKGQPVAVLRNRSLDMRLQQLATARQVKLQEAASAARAGDPAVQQLIQRVLDSIVSEEQNLVEQRNRLVLVAPVDGILMAPSRTAARQADDRAPSELASWSGSPIDAENLGCSLKPGILAFSVAPSKEVDAILQVSQADRNEVFPQQTVRLYLDQMPNQTVRGTVDSIAEGTAAESLTEQRATQGAFFLARVRVDAMPERGLASGSGRARCTVHARPAASWLWRGVRHTFDFAT